MTTHLMRRTFSTGCVGLCFVCALAAGCGGEIGPAHLHRPKRKTASKVS